METCIYIALCTVVIVTVTTGASCLSELLKVNNSLLELDMYHNYIGDDGILLVVDGLQCNNTLIKLNVERCGFSVKGIVVYKTEFKLFGHSSACTVQN